MEWGAWLEAVFGERPIAPTSKGSPPSGARTSRLSGIQDQPPPFLIYRFWRGFRGTITQTSRFGHLFPEWRSSILAASPFASLKSPVYSTVPFPPWKRNLQERSKSTQGRTDSTGNVEKRRSLACDPKGWPSLLWEPSRPFKALATDPNQL